MVGKMNPQSMINNQNHNPSYYPNQQGQMFNNKYPSNLPYMGNYPPQNMMPNMQNQMHYNQMQRPNNYYMNNYQMQMRNNMTMQNPINQGHLLNQNRNPVGYNPNNINMNYQGN